MSPKRQFVAPPAAPAIPSMNRDLFTELQSACNMIQDTWPNIDTIDPLPESENTGHENMNGFMAPLRQALRRGVGHAYTYDVNLFWHSPLASPMLWVPLYKSRVMELVKDLAPGQCTHGLVLVAISARAQTCLAAGAFVSVRTNGPMA